MNDPISPIDGRYFTKTQELKKYFNEYAFFKYRILVEIHYFINLVEVLPELSEFKSTLSKGDLIDKIQDIYINFNTEDYKEIKSIERSTNHDVKAVEYYIKSKFEQLEIDKYSSFIHFGLTSQDINTTANMLCLKNGIFDCLEPCLVEICHELFDISKNMGMSVMLSFTHGQPAVPTTMGKEFSVFMYRLECQLNKLKNCTFSTKFGGAVGNFNAHLLAYPKIDWEVFGDNFIKHLDLVREQCTTQISNYDNVCDILNTLKTMNNIVNDLNIDCWLYISKGYLKQKTVVTETGSSTMPHKVNPINFENSEGNICLANALIDGISGKLNISRLQRDLTDSTILRNIGVVMGYCLIAYKSTLTGLGKIMINESVISDDLNKNNVVLTEGIQTVMRKHGIQDAYEKMKKLSRGEDDFQIEQVIYSLNDDVKKDLDGLVITNYVGYSVL